jgi:hypothetical protein
MAALKLSLLKKFNTAVVKVSGMRRNGRNLFTENETAPNEHMYLETEREN